MDIKIQEEKVRDKLAKTQYISLTSNPCEVNLAISLIFWFQIFVY